MKGTELGDEVKLLGSADGMILYIESFNKYTKKLLELLNKFS